MKTQKITLEQQVCSLELAKKLKELGVGKESLFYWSIPNPQKTNNEKERIILDKFCEVELCHKQSDWGEMFESISAFTSSELGELLPGNDGDAYFTLQKGLMGNLWYCTRVNMSDNSPLHRTEADTEVDARALMLIHLIENKLIKI